MWVLAMVALILCGCSSDDPAPDPLKELPGLQLKNMNCSFSLNGEDMPDAFARFYAVPQSDEVNLLLTGIHPTEELQIPLTASGDGNGNILFEGDEPANNLRCIHVKGIYKPGADNGEKSPSIKIDLTYSVPSNTYSKEYVIPFDGYNGFLYNRDPGQYPMSKWDIEGQRDTCQSICKTINSELAKELKSLSFKFENNGRLTLSSTGPELNVSSQSFRYWLRTVSRDTLVNVENPALFYDFILNALNLNKKTAPDQYTYVPEYETAEIYVDRVSTLNNLKFSKAIVVRDDLRHKIFSYVRDKYQDCDTWGDRERRLLNTMEAVARRNYDGRNYSMPIYEWGFATWRE